jgi:diguanylate cyclase (GGDEF)-like protein
MRNEEKILVYSSKTKIIDDLKKEIKNFTLVRISYNAELLALSKGKDVAFIFIEIDTNKIGKDIQKIRDLRKLTSDVPVIVFADKLSPIIIQEITSLNVYDYLVTPINPEEIKRILRELSKGEKGKENYSLLYNLSEKLQQLSVENDIIRMLNSTYKLDDILDIIIQKAIQLVDVESASILLLDEKKEILTFNAVHGNRTDVLRGKALKLGEGISGWVAKEAQPVIVNDLANSKHFLDNALLDTEFKARSLLCTPIMTEHKIHGVVELLNKKKGRFNNQDLQKIMRLSSFAAFAFDKALLMKKERRRIEELTLLFEIGTYLSSMRNLEELLQKSAHLIRKSFGFYYVGIAILNSEDKILELRSFDSEENIEPKRRKIKFNQGLMGWVISYGMPLRIGDVKSDKRYLKGIESINSEMVIPLKRKDTILGVIDIGSKKLNAFNEDDQTLTEQIARLLSISIENAILYKKVGKLAVIDDLTGLYNSRYCHMLLERLQDRKSKVFSIIFLDLDFFKLVNDQFGHQVGSELLRETGQVIKSSCGKGTVNLRYGGDEFVTILPGKNKKQAFSVAKNILSSIKTNLFLKEKDINYHITASLGIASYPEDGLKPEKILRFADRSMYWVKSHGRNGIKKYSRDVHELSEYPSPTSLDRFLKDRKP